jgi:tRNA (cmo5U34)-methyltransferase
MPDKKKPIDTITSAVPGLWEFNEPISRIFDSHVRKSVPCYDEMQRLVREISEFFINDGSRIYDLGSATGETLFLLAQKHQIKKNIELIGIEQSRSMINSAQEKCSQFKNISFIHDDVTTFESFKDADMILSLYTLQFLPVHSRKKVIQRIYDSLNHGGAFVFAEKIYSGKHPVFEQISNDVHWEFKTAHGLTDEMILQKQRSLRGVLIPLTYEENIRLLHNAGFKVLDCFIRWLNFAGFLAIKTDHELSDTHLP